jgi:hypothetical protein
MADFAERLKAAATNAVSITGEPIEDGAEVLTLKGRGSLFEIPKAKIISRIDSDNAATGKQTTVHVEHDAQILQTVLRTARSLAASFGGQAGGASPSVSASQFECACRCACDCACNCLPTECGIIGDGPIDGGDPAECGDAFVAQPFGSRLSRFRRKLDR